MDFMVMAKVRCCVQLWLVWWRWTPYALSGPTGSTDYFSIYFENWLSTVISVELIISRIVSLIIITILRLLTAMYVCDRWQITPWFLFHQCIFPFSQITILSLICFKYQLTWFPVMRNISLLEIETSSFDVAWITPRLLVITGTWKRTWSLYNGNNCLHFSFPSIYRTLRSWGDWPKWESYH